MEDLVSFGTDQINVIEKIKDHFENNKINFKISAGGDKSLRSTLLKNSDLKESLVAY